MFCDYNSVLTKTEIAHLYASCSNNSAIVFKRRTTKLLSPTSPLEAHAIAYYKANYISINTNKVNSYISNIISIVYSTTSSSTPYFSFQFIMPIL